MMVLCYAELDPKYLKTKLIRKWQEFNSASSTALLNDQHNVMCVSCVVKSLSSLRINDFSNVLSLMASKLKAVISFTESVHLILVFFLFCCCIQFFLELLPFSSEFCTFFRVLNVGIENFWHVALLEPHVSRKLWVRVRAEVCRLYWLWGGRDIFGFITIKQLPCLQQPTGSLCAPLHPCNQILSLPPHWVFQLRVLPSPRQTGPLAEA